MNVMKINFLWGLAAMALLSQPATAVSLDNGVIIGGLALDELSQPLTGMHWLDLKLYQPSISNNVPVYAETHNVLFTNGAFSVTLGSQEPVPMEIGGGLLGFSVAGRPDTQPRLPLQPLRSTELNDGLEVLAFDRNAISGATQFRGSLLSYEYDYDSVSVVPYVVTSTGQVLYTGSAVNSDAVGGIFDLALGSLPSGLAPGDPDRLLRLALTAKYQDIPVLIDNFDMSLTFTASNVRIELQHLSAVTTVPIPPALWLFGSGLFGLIGIARRR